MTPPYGPARLLADVLELGLAATMMKSPAGKDFVVVDPFMVPVGRFEGRVIRLGLQTTPDFPKTVAAAIHVHSAPQLLDKADSLPNVRNIVDSELGPEWRYWSHNFGWSDEKSARRLLSQINQIFNDV